MNIQTLEVVSFNGHTLNDGTYRATIPIDVAPQAEAALTAVARADNFPVYSGLTLDGRTLPMTVERVDGGAIGGIVEWFPAHRNAEYALVVKDKTDNRQWYVMAKVKSTPRLRHNVLTVLFYVADPIWKTVETLEEIFEGVEDGDTLAVTVGGNEFARPILRVKPTSASSSGYAHNLFVALANRAALLYNDAINLAGGNWDTSALVTAGKMQASGADIRVIYDASGQEVPYWLGGGGANTTTTRLIANVSLPPAISLTLSGAMTDAETVTTITVKKTAANKATLKALAGEAYKVLAIDLGGGAQEIFTFTGVNQTAYQITGVTRAQKNTAEQSHADGAVIRHVIGYWVMYGNAGVAAPSAMDKYKPLYTLATFTNTSRSQAEFYDPANPARAGAFAPKVLKGVEAQADIYTANHYGDAGVATEMGMALKAYQVGTAWKAPAGSLAWDGYHPAGIKTVTVSGEKYRQDAGFPSVASLKKSADGKKYVLVANEGSPSAAATWEALSTVTGAKSLSGTYRHIRFEFTGGGVAAGKTGNYAALEFAGLTLELDGDVVPLIWWGSEVTNNYEVFRLTHQETGSWVEIAYPAPVGRTIVIDTDNLECYRDVDLSAVALQLDDESRAEWLPLSAGVNTLLYESEGDNSVDITVSWQERNL